MPPRRALPPEKAARLRTSVSKLPLKAVVSNPRIQTPNVSNSKAPSLVGPKNLEKKVALNSKDVHKLVGSRNVNGHDPKSASQATKGDPRGVDALVGAATGKVRSSGDIVVEGGRGRAKELFREFAVEGVENRTVVRDKTGGGRGIEGALDDGTPFRIRMKPDGTTRIQAGDQKFIFPQK